MKSKKLFAILTLVVFMMTLLPMAAFATSVSAPTVVLSNTVAAATPATVTVNFTATNGIAGGDTITLVLPAGMIAAGNPATMTATVNANAAASVAATTATNTVVVTNGATAIAAGTAVTLVISTTGANELVNPAAGAKTITVATTADTTATTSNTFYTTGAANRLTSSIVIDKDTVVADGSDFVKVTVNVSDNAGRPVNGQNVQIETDRDAETFEKYDTAIATQTLTSVDGVVKFQVKATVGGDVKLGVGFGTVLQLDTYLKDTTTSPATPQLVGSYQTIHFTSAAVGGVALATAPSVVADGLTQMLVVATVTTAGGSPVKDEAVTFSVNKTGLSFDKTSYTTDAFGNVTAKVTSTKSGDFEITAKASSKSASKTYTFTASTTAYNIELTKSPSTPVANTITSSNVIKLKVTDINGNRIKTGAPIAISTETKPAGGASGLALNATNTDTNGDWQYDVTPTVAGTYKVRFKLANGKFVDVTFESKKQGDITSITVSYDQPSLAINPNAFAVSAGGATVKRIDAAGVSATVILADASIQFSSSNPAKATVANTGIVTAATKDSKDAGVVVITVIDTLNNLVATTNYTLTGIPVSFKATAPADAVQKDTSAAVAIQFIDTNGTNVALNALPLSTTYTVVSKPAGAGVNVSYAGDAATKLRDTGATTVNISSTVAGDVVVQLRIQDGAGTWFYTPVTVKVGEPKVVVGAKAVTMFIGATGFVQDGTAKVNDVAPFIQDGRTFVAVRPIADAFGAEIGWNEATQTVTLTRSDMTLTIVIGSNTITKVAGGVTSTSTADVAAFIKDGRTVLPFRAVGEAFGATVSYDAATQAVSFAQ